MAVGPNFQDPDTQAALAAQGGSPAAPAAQPDPVTETPDPEASAVTDTVEVIPAAGAEGKETPAVETPETKESAESLNMDDVKVQSQEEIDKALADAGFSNDDLGQELVDNDGKMSVETINALKEKFPADAVDAAITDMEKRFADGQPEHDAKLAKAKADTLAMNDFIYGKLAGGDAEKGKANLATLSEWAKDNMDKKALTLINKKLASGDKDLVEEGLTQAVTAWKKGTKKPMMEGSAAATANAAQAPEFVPLSKDQFIQEMATEKYTKDPEYAAKIDARRRKTMETEGAITPEYSAVRPPI